MKRLLVVAVLVAAASQVQAGAVMPCARGYSKQALLGGSAKYSCVAQAGVRNVAPLSKAVCQPGLVVTSKTQPTVPGGRQSYTCGNLMGAIPGQNGGGLQRMPGSNGGGIQSLASKQAACRRQGLVYYQAPGQAGRCVSRLG